MKHRLLYIARAWDWPTLVTTFNLAYVLHVDNFIEIRWINDIPDPGAWPYLETADYVGAPLRLACKPLEQATVDNTAQCELEARSLVATHYILIPDGWYFRLRSTEGGLHLDPKNWRCATLSHDFSLEADNKVELHGGVRVEEDRRLKETEQSQTGDGE